MVQSVGVAHSAIASILTGRDRKLLK